jgi:hypothetical protein
MGDERRRGERWRRGRGRGEVGGEGQVGVRMGHVKELAGE